MEEGMPVSRKGLLLVNVGTPDEPTTPAVRRYLREFLSDPRVLDIPTAGRWALLNLVILPTRPKKSAEAYASVWGEEGSPLMAHSVAFTKKLQAELGEGWAVELGMRYGNPSLPSAIAALEARGVDEIVCFPLYPQYSSAATGTAKERVMEILRGKWNVPPARFVGAFYDEPSFLDAFAAVARPQIEAFRPDFVLLSYHGLPERHMRRGDPTGAHCLAKRDCCARVGEANKYCYRAQCYATTRGLVERLGLAEGAYETTFQSRLGRTPWIRPYTDEALPEIRKRGFKRVAVLCPAFVADCLETVEEIGVRAKEDWEEVGGEALELVTSLNAHDVWVRAAADILRRRA